MFECINKCLVFRKRVNRKAQHFSAGYFKKRTMRTILFFLAILSRLGRSYSGQCPSIQYKNVKILWIEYSSFQIKQESNGTVSGVVPRIMKKSLKLCCERLNYTFVKADYSSRTEHEDITLNAIKQQNDTIFVLYPALSHIGEDSSSSLLKFVPIKTSPGPMVLASKTSLQYDVHSRVFLQMWINPAFFLILAMSAAAGVMFWILVST